MCVELLYRLSKMSWKYQIILLEQYMLKTVGRIKMRNYVYFVLNSSFRFVFSLAKFIFRWIHCLEKNMHNLTHRRTVAITYFQLSFKSQKGAYLHIVRKNQVLVIKNNVDRPTYLPLISEVWNCNLNRSKAIVYLLYCWNMYCRSTTL